MTWTFNIKIKLENIGPETCKLNWDIIKAYRIYISVVIVRPKKILVSKFKMSY